MGKIFMPPKKQLLNIPDAKLPRTPHTIGELEKAARERVSRIGKEFEKGFKLIKNYERSATFFGSAREKRGSPYYEKARRIAYTLSKEGFAIVTGGGPGIMEAANRGAQEAGGPSVGLNIRLPREQVGNPYTTEAVEFYYFFTRKVTLSFSAEAYIYFPGGFGTLDEFYEVLTLVQTHRIPKVPIILVGRSYWKKLHQFMERELRSKKMVGRHDTKFYRITDSEEEIINMVKRAPLRKE